MKPTYRILRNAKPPSGVKIYPWDKLRRRGDAFIWPDISKYKSLRVQAVRMRKVLGASVSVSKLATGVQVTRL